MISAKDIPNLQYKLTKTEGSSKVREELKNSLEGTQEVVEVTESDVLTKSIITSSKGPLKSSKIRESSGNSLKSVADVALRLTDTECSMRITSDAKLQRKHSESREHLEESPYSAAGVALQCTIPSRTLELVCGTNSKRQPAKLVSTRKTRVVMK